MKQVLGSGGGFIETDCLIVGSGSAGYTAAIYAARAGLEPVVLKGLSPGGQLTITEEVENYPGFEEVISGPALMLAMEKQARRVGVILEDDALTHLDLSPTLALQPPFRCQTENHKEYHANTVIIATGAKTRWLGLPSEEKFKGAGISSCATCDGFFFKGQKVCVIGGGNSAVEGALHLSKVCREVVLIHRRATLRAEKILQDRLWKQQNISFLWDTVVREFLGDKTLAAVSCQQVKTSKTHSLSTDGAFVMIGHIPQTDLFKGKLPMDEDGYLVVEPGSPKTPVEGIFAAGDVTDKVYRQAVTAAALGCQAALEAQKFLQEKAL